MNTQVVFEVDTFDESTKSGWSVVARGTTLDLTSSENELVDVDTWAPGPKSCRIGIAIDQVTGRLLRGEVPANWVHPDGYL